MKSLGVILVLIGSFSAQAAKVTYGYSCVDEEKTLLVDNTELTIRPDPYHDFSNITAKALKKEATDLMDTREVVYIDEKKQPLILATKAVYNIKETDRHDEKGGYGVSWVKHSFNIAGAIYIDRINVQDFTLNCTQTRYTDDR